MNVVRGIRRTSIVAIVVSLVIAAILGIIALLSGEFGETQNKVLMTTLTIAAFGTTALCHLAVVARAVRLVGFAGLAASAAAALCAFVLIWGDWGTYDWQAPWYKALSVLAILAVSLAQANLLLLLAGRPQVLIRIALGVTLIAIAVVAVMFWIPILTDYEVPGMNADTYWRWFGVVTIVDVLGTIALPILGLILRRADPQAATALSLDLGSELRARLDARALAEGTTSEVLALGFVEKGLGPATP